MMDLSPGTAPDSRPVEPGTGPEGGPYGVERGPSSGTSCARSSAAVQNH